MGLMSSLSSVCFIDAERRTRPVGRDRRSATLTGTAPDPPQTEQRPHRMAAGRLGSGTETGTSVTRPRRAIRPDRAFRRICSTVRGFFLNDRFEYFTDASREYGRQ